MFISNRHCSQKRYKAETILLFCISLIALGLLFAAVAAAQLPATISLTATRQIAVSKGYLVPTDKGWLYRITSGPDGALWFTEYNANMIGRITTAGVIAEYAVPTPNGGPYGITAGPDGALWFTEISGNKIGRITTAGVITEYPLTPSIQPSSITAGPDGALWFISDGCSIGRITTAGVITGYGFTGCSGGPNAITAGPDGALWFTDYGFNLIGRITTAGAITQYSLPTADCIPNGITAGPDGALWFTEGQGNQIGRISTAGVVTEYPIPTPNNTPLAITTGPDGALWFTQANGSAKKIGRITTDGVITEYPAPSPSDWPTAITPGPDGELWFTESESNRIGEVFFLNATLSVNPASGAYGASLSFTGSGFAPHESVQIYQSGIGSAILASGAADASGSFTAAAQVPQSGYGERLFLAMGQTTGKLGAAKFSILPRLILQPTSGPVGSTVTARGAGFVPLRKLDIYWANPRILLGTTFADVYGTFSNSAAVTFTVPSGASSGVNRVDAQGNRVSNSASASFTVQ